MNTDHALEEIRRLQDLRTTDGTPVKYLTCFGPPGSSKDTVSNLVVSLLPAPHSERCGILPMSKLLQEGSKRNDPLGQELARQIVSRLHKGLLFDDGVCTQVFVEGILAMAECNISTIFLNGYPRTNVQAGLFKTAHPTLTTFHLLISEEERLKRLRERATREGRPDDASPENVQIRMGIFKKELVMLNTLRQMGDVIEVNADEQMPAPLIPILTTLGFSQTEIHRLLQQLVDTTHPSQKMLRKFALTVSESDIDSLFPPPVSKNAMTHMVTA